MYSIGREIESSFCCPILSKLTFLPLNASIAGSLLTTKWRLPTIEAFKGRKVNFEHDDRKGFGSENRLLIFVVPSISGKENEVF